MTYNKMTYLFAALALTLCAACGDDKPEDPNKDNGGDTSGSGEVITVKSSLTIDLATDKAAYAPGATVTFTASEANTDAKVRYRHGSQVVAEHPMTGTSWTWTAPAGDYKGYMVDIYTGTDTEERILGAIAVDVSSDWKMFPRYGFVATFDRSKLADGVIEAEMEFLNRCHINGVQFQDWHYKHHWPLGGTRGNLLPTYTDIAMREVSTDVVKKYITIQHAYGMKSIFYNLCFGVLDDAAVDGVKEEWALYKGKNRTNRDFHGLPSSWKSDIYLVNPANKEWQEYLAERNDEVYASLDFDGFQIDQLGYRGDLYDYNSNPVNLPDGYASFINAVKAKHPDKGLIMNAVSGYGANTILGTGKVEFAYNEMWGGEADFKDLHSAIRANEAYSGGNCRTVFAAYMNYDKADRERGEMNTPGVIMADAVMMALGGAHLELGDHMLSREYFPAAPLAMSDELKDAMIKYYDFSTAYQNILRGTTTSDEFAADVKCTDSSKRLNFNSWPVQTGGITTYAREKDGKQYIHLLNCRNLEDTSWRDLNGTRPAPRLTLNIPLEIKTSTKVSKVWTASPDYHGGVPVPLAFTQTGNTLSITLPSLKYWAMLVVE